MKERGVEGDSQVLSSSSGRTKLTEVGTGGEPIGSWFGGHVMFEVSVRSPHADVKQEVGSLGLESGEGSWLDV